MTMTFDDFDVLEQEAMDEELPEDFIFPTEAEIPFLLSDRDGIKKLMMAYNNTPQDSLHKNYLSILLSALHSGVKLVDTEEEVKAATSKVETNSSKIEKIKERVEAMNFKAENFYPTQQELEKYVSQNTEENIAFLYWMSKIPNEELTKDQKKTKAYANLVVNSWIKTTTKGRRVQHG